MMKKIIPLFIILFFAACKSKQNTVALVTEKEKVNKVLLQWHKAAADADFDTYFGLMSNDAVFIGTDATENWEVKDFKSFSKPFFKKGKAWSFKAVDRNIFVNSSGKIAWFDELLDTWMGSCRGSGVVEKKNGQWKIRHYVLSITVPNDHVKVVKILKRDQDSLVLKQK